MVLAFNPMRSRASHTVGFRLAAKRVPAPQVTSPAAVLNPPSALCVGSRKPERPAIAKVFGLCSNSRNDHPRSRCAFGQLD
jgi:hypothetical protein